MQYTSPREVPTRWSLLKAAIVHAKTVFFARTTCRHCSAPVRAGDTAWTLPLAQEPFIIDPHGVACSYHCAFALSDPKPKILPEFLEMELERLGDDFEDTRDPFNRWDKGVL